MFSAATLLLSDFLKLEFSLHKFKKKILKYQISLKSVQWEPSCSTQIEGQTDRQAGRQAGRQADRQTGRQAGRQAGRRD